MWPLNLNLSNWWPWLSPNVNITVDCLQERDEWIIITILKTRESSCCFLSFDTSVLVSAYNQSSSPLFSVIVARTPAYHWQLWTLNLSLNVEGHWVLAFPLLPPSVSDGCCLLSCFRSFKARRISLMSRCQSIQGHGVIWGQQRCCRLAFRIPLCMRFILFQGKWDAWKKWGKVGNHPIINTCWAENESCFQSELNSCLPAISLLLFTWLQRGLREPPLFFIEHN